MALAAPVALLVFCGQAFASSVQSPTLSAGSDAAGAATGYAVTFTATHALSAPSGSITLDASTGAPGTQFAGGDGFFNNGFILTDNTTSTEYALIDSNIIVSNQGQTVSVQLLDDTADVTINAGDQVTLDVPATNPTVSSPLNSLAVSTTQDTTPVASAIYAIEAAAPAQVLPQSGAGQSAAVGSVFGAPFAAEVVDQYGNPVPGETVDFDAPVSGEGGSFTASGNGTDSAVTDAAGVATSSAFTANTIAGHYQVIAADGAASSGHFGVTNLPGPPASVELGLSSSSLPADGVSTTIATATVFDADGNPISGQDVSIGSTGLDQDVGPTIAHPDATYTALITAGTSDGSAQVKATDTTPDPDLDSSSEPLAQAAVAPSAVTSAADGITTAAATLGGVVNPHALDTTYHFEYGPSASYGASTPAAGAGSGAIDKAVSAAVAGLSPGSTYHYRLVATNTAGTTNGPDRTFTTSSPAQPTGGAGGGSSSTPLAHLALLGSVKAGTTAVSVKLSCTSAPCHGRLLLKAGGRTLGSRSFSLAKGAKSTLEVHLTKSARRLLASRRRLKATLTIALTRTGARATVIKRVVRLAAPHARRRG
jgi:invasin-like protein